MGDDKPDRISCDLLIIDDSEQEWKLNEYPHQKRSFTPKPQPFTAAHDETLALTERITQIEREIDSSVAALYDVSLDKQD